MIAAPAPTLAAAPNPRQGIAAFAAQASFEATRLADGDLEALRGFPSCRRVYVSAVPARPPQAQIDVACRLAAAGVEPVPHLAVRAFASGAALDSHLARLVEGAGVRRVLVIGGDLAIRAGPFKAAIELIESGLLQARGIVEIGIAGYPDGHPRIGPDELHRALAEKIAAAEATGLAVDIVTQFCFDARTILDYVARLRAFGFDHPMRAGLAGPASLSSLLRYASRCGVRASAQALAQRAGLIRQVFAMAVPDDLIRSLADAAPAHVSVHFFSFGGLGGTARWAQAVADARIAIERDSGFRVVSPQREG